MKNFESPCVDALESAPDLAEIIARSIMFRTFVRMYEAEFQFPLYLESASHSGKLNHVRNQSEFCTELNRGNGDCTGCRFNILPRPQTLSPWTWSAPCRLGQQVTLVPLLADGHAVAWLISGHYFVGEGAVGTQGLSDEVMGRITTDERRREFLTQTYGKIPTIPKTLHDLMVRFLETCAALIGANLNRFLMECDWQQAERCDAAVVGRMEAANSDDFQGNGRDLITGMGAEKEEIATRARIEKARRSLLRTPGHDADISLAGKEAGWVDDGDFRQAFLECVGESPSAHWRKMTGLWSDFSKVLADSDHQLARDQR